jgi:UDP-N-acetylglucosamine:LPS N-acetylglucosamine transferase
MSTQLFSRRGSGPRVLAVASGGGHWVELLSLRPAFAGCDVAYLTVGREYRDDVRGARFYATNDATRWNKAALLLCAVRIALVILRERPDVIVSTGAAPGYFAVRIGKWLGARTCWIDSIANVDELSLSGRRAGPFADLWLTQWRHLARSGGPVFKGAVV